MLSSSRSSAAQPVRVAAFLAPLAATLCASALAGGCRFGEATFDSTVPGRTFEPGGTVFAYLDERADDLTADLTEDNDPRLVVVMTWILFDPNGDLNELEGSALADYAHELKLRDALALVFDRVSALEDKATFSTTLASGVEKGALSSRVHLAPEPLTRTSTYADVEPLASRRTTDVTVTADLLGESSPTLAADVTIQYERAESDRGTAREGSFTGRFTAPLVEERVAEQNLALLDVESILGLPLPPRVGGGAP